MINKPLKLYKIMATTQTILCADVEKCIVDKEKVWLPKMPLQNYPELRKALLNAGAKYVRNTFVFPTEAQPYIDRITGGEKVNIKKEFQFFPTPAKIADRMVELADLHPNHDVLEPSAGQGAIIKAIHRVLPEMDVNWCEIMDINNHVCQKINNATWICDDFLDYKPFGLYDRIIANPPFSKKQDIDHVMHMWKCLKPGGRIVVITSLSWTFASDKKSKAFRDFMDEYGHYEGIEPGEFKESGTMIQTLLCVIDKPSGK